MAKEDRIAFTAYPHDRELIAELRKSLPPFSIKNVLVAGLHALRREVAAVGVEEWRRRYALDVMTGTPVTGTDVEVPRAANG